MSNPRQHSTSPRRRARAGASRTVPRPSRDGGLATDRWVASNVASFLRAVAIHSWELSLFSFFSLVYLLSPGHLEDDRVDLLAVDVLRALVRRVDEEVFCDLFIVIRHRRLLCGLDPVAEQLCEHRSVPPRPVPDKGLSSDAEQQRRRSLSCLVSLGTRSRAARASS